MGRQALGSAGVEIGPANQLEELHARARIGLEAAEHGARDRERVLLLDAAHRHAQVRGLDDYRDADGLNFLPDCLRNLARHPFLDLEPARENLDKPRYLAETDDLATRDVGNVTAAEEWQQMMLTKAVEVDVLDDHHLVIIHREQRVIEHGVD